jgi:hypothetical protein
VNAKKNRFLIVTVRLSFDYTTGHSNQETVIRPEDNSTEGVREQDAEENIWT